jgi:ATP-binding cassette, subfamily B, bacterial
LERGAIAGRVPSTRPGAIAALEDQELLAHLSEAGGELEYNPNTPGRAVAGLISLIYRYLPVFAAAVVVAIAFSPLAAVGLLAAALAIRHGTRRGLVTDNEQWSANMANWRESWYFRSLVLEPTAGKELRLFALGPWTKARHLAAHERAWKAHWPQRRRVYAHAIARYAAGGVLVCVAVLAVLGREAARGSVSLRDMALVLQAAGIIIRVGMIFIESDGATEFGMSAYRALRSFEDETAQRYGRGAPARPGARVDTDGLPREAIRFEGVSFSYPGSDRPVLDGLDLEIPAGRSLAIVGLNGAGKTTLIKLLARLYEPTAGRITVDGVDVRDLELRSWRKRIGVTFQDFVRYELSAADNIGFGAVAQLGDEPALRLVAQRAGALELLEGLPLGLRTPLSARYSDGTDLSGGQWQRIALARALFALEGGASVLILDEPTANLDVRAEVELFDRFIELTTGVTTILVSHRFSTVRRADRIVVLEDGRIVEDGSHDGLLVAGGRYEELFRLQAASFTAGDGVPDQEPLEEHP